MREIRPSGSEGGARFNPLSLPYRQEPVQSLDLAAGTSTHSTGNSEKTLFLPDRGNAPSHSLSHGPHKSVFEDSVSG